MSQRLSKRLLKHPGFLHFAGLLLALYIRLVHRTTRWHIDHPERLEACAGAPTIYAFWHGRMMMMAAFRPRGRNMAALISRHGDGGLIAAIMRPFGVEGVRGSTGKGGAAALHRLAALIREEGYSVCITPDGPRGPHQTLQPGVIRLAALTGRPILPASFAATRHRRLKSWDRFFLALPFGRGHIAVGDPFTVPPDLSPAAEQQACEELERRLTALTVACDKACHSEDKDTKKKNDSR